MGDWIDRAVALQESVLEAILANRAPPKSPSAICLNCDEPLHNRINYCDADCRDDHQRRTASRPRTLKVVEDE